MRFVLGIGLLLGRRMETSSTLEWNWWLGKSFARRCFCVLFADLQHPSLGGRSTVFCYRAVMAHGKPAGLNLSSRPSLFVCGTEIGLVTVSDGFGIRPNGQIVFVF